MRLKPHETLGFLSNPTKETYENDSLELSRPTDPHETRVLRDLEISSIFLALGVDFFENLSLQNH